MTDCSFLPEVRVLKRQSSTSSRRLRCWRRTEWTLIHARWSLQYKFILEFTSFLSLCFMCNLVQLYGFWVNEWNEFVILRSWSVLYQCRKCTRKYLTVISNSDPTITETWLYVPVRMCLATQLFWLLLLLDSLCCKETGGSISSNGESRLTVKTGHNAR